MARDWGLCYTALDNLEIAEDLLAGWEPPGPVAVHAAAGIEELKERIELAPKSAALEGPRPRRAPGSAGMRTSATREQQGQGDAGTRER